MERTDDRVQIPRALTNHFFQQINLTQESLGMLFNQTTERDFYRSSSREHGKLVSNVLEKRYCLHPDQQQIGSSKISTKSKGGAASSGAPEKQRFKEEKYSSQQRKYSAPRSSQRIGLASRKSQRGAAELIKDGSSMFSRAAHQKSSVIQ